MSGDCVHAWEANGDCVYCGKNANDLERQLADALVWQDGMKVMLNHEADKLSADAWSDSEGNTLTKDEMVAEVASNLRVFAVGARYRIKPEPREWWAIIKPQCSSDKTTIVVCADEAESVRLATNGWTQVKVREVIDES